MSHVRLITLHSEKSHVANVPTNQSGKNFCPVACHKCPNQPTRKNFCPVACHKCPNPHARTTETICLPRFISHKARLWKSHLGRALSWLRQLSVSEWRRFGSPSLTESWRGRQRGAV